MKFSKITKAALVASTIVALAACEGTNDGSNNSPAIDPNTGLQSIQLFNVDPTVKESAGDYLHADAKAKVTINQFSSESNAITFNLPKDITGTDANKLVNTKILYTQIKPGQAVESIYVNDTLIIQNQESATKIDLGSATTNKLKLIYSATESRSFDIILNTASDSSNVLLNAVELRKDNQESSLPLAMTVITAPTGVIKSTINNVESVTSLYPTFKFAATIQESLAPTVNEAGKAVNFTKVSDTKSVATYTVTSKDGKTTVVYPNVLTNPAASDKLGIGCNLESSVVTSCAVDNATHILTINTLHGVAEANGIFRFSYLGKTVKVGGANTTESNPYVSDGALTFNATPVTVTLTAADASTQDYQVTVVPAATFIK